MADMTHREVLEQFDHDYRSDSDNRDDALEDLRFMAGDQWNDAERKARQADGRPCLTVNRMAQFVLQVANDIRQARPAIRAIPVDENSDIQIAEIINGIMRQIQYRSKAHIAYGTAVSNAIACGIGHHRVETAYVRDDVFEQEIRISEILDPLSVTWDAAAVKIDRSDAARCYVTDMVTKEDWKERYGKQKTHGSDFPVDTDTGNLYWRNGDKVRIAEYWYRKPYQGRLVMLDSGQVLDVTDMRDDQIAFMGQIVRERKVQRFKIYRQMMDGDDFLGDPEEWAGQYIPIIPTVGSQVAFDGKIIRSGMIRSAKDPQRLYNIWRSAAAELIGKSPKAPWLVTFDMVKGLEGYWSNANRSNLPYLPYNPDPNAPTAKPERQEPPTAPSAMWQEALVAAEDMKATTGIYDAALGAKSNEISGRAILARDRQGDTANYHYSDTFKASIQRTGEILIDLIPRVYDSERIIRILGDKDEEQFVPINATVMAMDGQPILINDLSTGRFDVRVEMGASQTSARTEARELMIEALQSNPQLWGVIGDLVFKYSDAEGADEIAERIKKTIPPQITGDEEAMAEQAQPDPIAEIAQRLEIEGLAAKTDETKANAALKEAQRVKVLVDAGKTEADTEKTRAETAGAEISNLTNAVTLASPQEFAPPSSAQPGF